MIIDKCKQALTTKVLADCKDIGFLDVGSGGPIKWPWTLLPEDKIARFEFDGESESDVSKPLCISDVKKNGTFYIARDPRASSLHKASESFVSWYGLDELLPAKTIEVRLDTLDNLFSDSLSKIDLIDVNVEGHDFQVLCGAKNIFKNGFVKMIKVEFEFAETWKGQGFFGDIDALMRQHGFNLVDMHFTQLHPANAKGLPEVKGEPVWGKAVYIPGLGRWEAHKNNVDQLTFSRDLKIGIASAVIYDLQGRAIALSDMLNVLVPASQSLNMKDELAGVYKFRKLDQFQRLLRRRIMNSRTWIGTLIKENLGDAAFKNIKKLLRI